MSLVSWYQASISIAVWQSNHTDINLHHRRSSLPSFIVLAFIPNSVTQ